MSKTFRLGVLGLTHDHVWGNLKELRGLGKAELVAAADPNRALLEQVQHEHGCAVYTEYESMLAKERLDAVYVYSDNACGARLTELAAARGLHVLIEKPMAASLDDADRMLAAVRRAGVRLMVNWPFAWWPQLQHALHLAQGGALGRLWQVKYRAAHQGPRELGCSPYFCDWLYDPRRNGAGALLDYCCYGAALARCLLGMPSRVTAVAGRLLKQDITVEDNGILVLAYPHALAIAEGSWTQVSHLDAYVPRIYGTEGALMLWPRKGGKLIRASAQAPEGEEVAVPQPAPHLQSASAHFLHALESGEPFFELCSDQVGRDTQEILAAGLLAAQRGTEVSLPLKNCLRPP
jgi:predicted dehydrogenase